MIDEERERRLGEALRANLRRRKAQARAQGEIASGEERSPSERGDAAAIDAPAKA